MMTTSNSLKEQDDADNRRTASPHAQENAAPLSMAPVGNIPSPNVCQSSVEYNERMDAYEKGLESTMEANAKTYRQSEKILRKLQNAHNFFLASARHEAFWCLALLLVLLALSLPDHLNHVNAVATRKVIKQHTKDSYPHIRWDDI